MKKEVVVSDKIPKPIAPYSPGIKARNFVFTSGQVAFDRAALCTLLRRSLGDIGRRRRAGSILGSIGGSRGAFRKPCVQKAPQTVQQRCPVGACQGAEANAILHNGRFGSRKKPLSTVRLWLTIPRQKELLNTWHSISE